MRNVSASNRSVTDVEMTTFTTNVEGNSSRNLNPKRERIEVQTVKQKVKDEGSQNDIR